MPKIGGIFRIIAASGRDIGAAATKGMAERAGETFWPNGRLRPKRMTASDSREEHKIGEDADE